MKKRLNLPVLLQYLAALVLSLLILTLALRLWVADLSIPLSYEGDFVFGLGQVKGIIQTGWIFQNPLLGAPFGSNMYDFPLPENLLIAILRFLTLFSSNPFLVLNIFYLLGFPLTALTSLYALKGLRLPYYLALPGALAVTFLPYHFLRINHTLLSQYFMLPLVILLAVRVMQGELEIFRWDVKNRQFSAAWRSPATWGALLICVLAASTGVYYAVFCVFLLGVAALRCLLSEWKDLKLAGSLTGLALAAVLGLALLANFMPLLINKASQPPIFEAGLVRRPIDTESYGLKLIQLLLPRPDHQIAYLARVNRFYQIEFRDNNENNFASLGFIGALGFLASLGMLVKGSSGRDDPVKSLSVLNLACFLLGTVGGFAALVSFLITPEIRSVNRVSALIGFISIAIFCMLLQRTLGFARRLVIRQKARLTLALKVLVVVGLVAVIYVDQTGSPVTNAEYTQVRTAFETDRSFIQSVETSLPKGALVFQLPYLPFPEGGSKYYLTDYDHLKPYLLSDQLHWSFGGLRGRLAGSWYRDISTLPVEPMLQSLTAAGFSGIYINREGYTPLEDAAVENDLKRLLGVLPRQDANQNRAFYDMQAFAAAYKAKFSQAEWEKQVHDVMFSVYRAVGLGFTGQFYEPENVEGVDIRRSGRNSGLILQNLTSTEQTIVLSFDVATSTNNPANFTVSSSFWNKTYPIDGKPRTLEREVVIPVGQKISISFSSDADLYRLPSGDPREVVFQFTAVTLRYKN